LLPLNGRADNGKYELDAEVSLEAFWGNEGPFLSFKHQSLKSFFMQEQEEHQKGQKFSKQVQGVGGLKALNEGLLGQDKVQGMLGGYTNVKSELSVKEDLVKDTETNSLSMAANNKYAMKSRSNITLIQNQGEHQMVA
tara:strand:+ start:145 stop:558 length:414 start_codon:yes stop_codon:yes gene_type:complete